ncbi:hypothetical protein [Bacillus cereus]|uniref:hypothetical protein n=1 Tax=Bacillus cereus TaxID=1396 RepID=UPI000B4B6532|nr:hypothetical protein [Bacillus cereus]
MLRKGVKIFKHINQRSALDITHNLEYFKEKEEKEEKEFKGNIIVSITSDNKYLKAYIAKSKAKLLFKSVLDGNFSKFYSDGFKDYGGSFRDGQVISRTLKIEGISNGDKVQFRFTIQEGPGMKTQTGAIKPSGKPTTVVQSYLDITGMRECAMEVLSYVTSAEIAAQISGRPLHTLTNISYEPDVVKGNNTDTSFTTVINSIEKLSNDELKQLIGRVNDEYSKRVQAYKQNKNAE